MDYRDRIRKHIIEEFIQEYSYAPNMEQINELYIEKETQLKGIQKFGFYGLGSDKYNFQNNSSSKLENSNRELLREDLEYQRYSSDMIYENLSSNINSMTSVLSRLCRTLDSEEKRVNNLLLLKNKTDLFTNSVEENFENHNNVDFLKSNNILTEDGYVTLEPKKNKNISLKNKKITISFYSDGKLHNKNIINPVSNITSHNNKRFLANIYSSSKNTEVGYKLTISLEDKEYIGGIKLFSNPLDGNSKSKYKIYYSIDGQNFSEVNSFYKVLDKGENYTQIGVDNILKIRVEVKKDRPDYIDNYNSRSEYYFSLDTVELNTYGFDKNQRGELYLGPYDIVDIKGDPVLYSMASLSHGTCCIVPDKTFINFFLSKDGDNWHPISQDKNGKSTVRFNNIEFNLFKYKLENDKSLFSLTVDKYDFLDNNTERTLNFYLTVEDMQNISPQLITIERNVKQNKMIRDCTGGWSKENNLYSCWFVVDNIEGKVFDFGSTVCEIDGKEISGKIEVAQGYHKIVTNSSNWLNVDPNIKSALSLEASDSLYPYNHKYIIEGYNYQTDFIGEKIYYGSDKNFAYKMNYVPPQKFEEASDMNIFTYVEEDGLVYFKMKVDEKDKEWMKEINNVIIYKNNDSSNKLYIKAIIETNKENITPHINSIGVRVI